ncbi:MAG: inositol monophosphatase family protein [Planctomycetota bacterium]
MSGWSEDQERALVVARRAAREAGEILKGFFGRLSGQRIAVKSSPRDLVTEADLASERHLVRRLRDAFPDHRIEAEEEVQDEDDGQPRWFVDPLDGTINFVHGLPIFAVSLALLSEGTPEVAVVYSPMLREMFAARRGGGATLDDVPIHVSETAELGQAILGTGFPYRRTELAHDNLANFARFFPDVRGLRRMGSAALDLAFTAAGRLDGFWELHLSPHDVAAGALLVREAGGIVTDAGGGDDWLRGKSIVAAGPALHPELLKRIEH